MPSVTHFSSRLRKEWIVRHRRNVSSICMGIAGACAQITGFVSFVQERPRASCMDSYVEVRMIARPSSKSCR